MTNASYIPLPNRGLIHIEGDDRIEFLQGLISQDVTKLAEAQIMYGCLLTPNGKFLHDFFLHHGDDFILIDCEGAERAQDLYDRLTKYRLRSDVFISVEKHNPVFAIFNADYGLPDPRHFKLGNRAFEKPDGLHEENFNEWDLERITLGIPDGSRDMKIESSTLLECNIDKFNGIDFDKGCYMGQELTARMHYRNLGKKHLQALKLKGTPPDPFDDIIIDDKKIGNMRSSCGTIGLAIIKQEYLEDLKDDTNSICLLG